MSDMMRPQKPMPRFLNAALYRAPFTRDENGKQVLTWLMQRCGFLQKIETEEQRLIHNWGVVLLENMGILGTEANYRSIVDTMLGFPLPDTPDRKE